MYDYTVFNGRFQIPHKAHLETIKAALAKSHKLILLFGSQNSARTLRNPLTVMDRMALIRLSGDPAIEQAIKDKRILMAGVDDFTYRNGAWVKEVQTIVNRIINADCPVFLATYVDDQLNPEVKRRSEEGVKIALIGCNKDNTSYYLSMFPQWDSISQPVMTGINSTELRTKLFSGQSIDDCENITSTGIIQWLKHFRTTKECATLIEEYEWVQSHKQIWAAAPYPPTFNTVDAVVVQSGHVLLVKRRARPGKGMWALPGGYLNQDETLEQAMLRELREETRININDKILRSNIIKDETFADPHRSPRGRTITQAFLIKLPDAISLPKVKGSDDAEKAKWVPLASLRASELFEDHYFIIQKLIAEL